MSLLHPLTTTDSTEKPIQPLRTSTNFEVKRRLNDKIQVMADSSELEALRNARMAEMMASQQGGGGGGHGADAEAARRAELEDQRAAMLAKLLLPAVGIDIDLDRRALAHRAP